MNRIEATEILRQFEEHRALVNSGQDRRWRWRNGTLLFPEGRCCYCGGVVRSNRLWVVDGDWLRGQLDVRADKAVWERPEHPHSGTDGALCTGGNEPLTALFFGINPTDVLRRGMDVRKWYAEMFGHICAESALKPADGIFVAETGRHRDRRPDCACCGCNPDAGRCGCGHDECHCDSFLCYRCEERFDLDDYEPLVGGDDELYCGRCYGLRWVGCRWCGVTMPRPEIQQDGPFYCAEHVTPELRGEELNAPVAVEAPEGYNLVPALSWDDILRGPAPQPVAPRQETRHGRRVRERIAAARTTEAISLRLVRQRFAEQVERDAQLLEERVALEAEAAEARAMADEEPDVAF